MKQKGLELVRRLLQANIMISERYSRVRYNHLGGSDDWLTIVGIFYAVG